MIQSAVKSNGLEISKNRVTDFHNNKQSDDQGALQMSEIVEFARSSVRKNSRRAAKAALVEQIIEALDKLGGSAHRDIVIEQIVRDRGIQNPEDIDRLRRQINQVFIEHCEGPAGPAAVPPLFSRMFGPDSRRWTISRELRSSLNYGGVDFEQLVL